MGTATSQNQRIGLIGFRYDENSSFIRGAADAPPVIREAFRSEASTLWSESGINLGEAETFFDAGDVCPTDGKDMMSTIESSITQLLTKDLCPVSLGGDHSITYPILRALVKKHSAITILHFDAHPDLYDDFQGNRLSHASPFARIMEEGLAKRLVQVGIRALNQHQREQAGRFAVEMHQMKDWRDDLNLSFERPVYLSVDIDGLDPAYAPGVSHPEPGGLTTRQVIDLIQQVNQPIVGADIVEFNPRRDVNNLTAVVCAKILKELSARILEVNG